MALEEKNKLIELFDRLSTTSSFKQKSDIVSQAKHFIFNQMNEDEIRAFFVNNPSNFENLFVLNIWTKSLEESGGIVDLTEVYDIIEKIFHTFKTLNDLVKFFYDQIVFLLNSSNVSSEYQSREEFESKLKKLLVLFVEQIPNTTASYTILLTDLICFLTVRLDKIEAKHQEDQQRVHVFSCSIFENNLDLLKTLEKVSNLNSVQSFRIMEMFIRLATISNNHLMNISEEKYNLSEHLNHYLNDTSDLLSQLNCIELMGDLVVPAHGYFFMQKSGHLNNLIRFLEKSSLDDSNAQILIPSIVKLFGQITKERPQESKEHFPIYFDYLFRTAQNENLVKHAESIQFVIETFCFIFENNIVKKFTAENYQKEFSNLLERLVWMTKNCINDRIKTNALKCLSELFCPDSSLLDCDDTDTKWKHSHWITSEWINFSKNVYDHVTSIIPHENFLNLCLSFAKEPFAENRKSAHYYFKALSQTEWGLRLLFTPNKYNSEESFVDGYLMNRSIELDKPSLESKLEIIKLMVANFESDPILINIIGDVVYEKLKHYVNEGAFWIRGESRVAFESV
ncbi:unnamed protein product [Brachionus calyciflorus]|uniref:26S proteasome non-ATPase regulatory subunit 5 n=1 Tax=Brachionus calyciflorus TaxID=104777 RepID=A0A814N6B9_9BILA|nr:unnamed protein product [Brachionus calyciflorus]